MPVTFRMTNEKKPLIIIYNENINIEDLYKRNGYQLPEIISDTKEILDSSGLPANSTVIFANKRTEQIQNYNDPTIVNILEMLDRAGVRLDNDAFTHFQDLLNYPADLAAEAAAAQEAGLSEKEWYALKFEDGDRVTPLLPGLQQYLERQENRQAMPKPTVAINIRNNNNNPDPKTESKFDLQYAQNNFGVMKTFINMTFEDETPEIDDNEWNEFVACVKALPRLPDKSNLNYKGMNQLRVALEQPKSILPELQENQFKEASQYASYLIGEWLRANPNPPSKKQQISQAAEIRQGSLKNITIRVDEASDMVLMQRINACTLISVSVIKSLLEAENLGESELQDLIRMAHTEGVSLFTAPYDQVMGDERIDIDALAENLHGISETQAHGQFKEFFTETSRQELVEPANDGIIREFFATRDSFDDYMEFLTYNDGLITAVSRLLPPAEDVDLSAISEADFRRLARIDAAKPSLLNQFEALIKGLKNEGVTINSDGHTISLVNRSGKYYSYDSLNGNLCVTENAREMAEYLRNKISVSSAAQVYHFKPKAVKAAVAAPVVNAVGNGPKQAAAVPASRDNSRFYPQGASNSPELKSANTQAGAEEPPVITEPYSQNKLDALARVQQLKDELGMTLADAIKVGISDREDPTGNRELDALNDAVSAYLRSWLNQFDKPVAKPNQPAAAKSNQPAAAPASRDNSRFYPQGASNSPELKSANTQAGAEKPAAVARPQGNVMFQPGRSAIVENRITMTKAQIDEAQRLVTKLDRQIEDILPRFGKADKKPEKLRVLKELLQLNSNGKLTAAYVEKLRTNKLVYDGETQKLLDAIHPPVHSKVHEKKRGV